MALQQLVGDGASCSGGNAMKGLASQMDRDRSLIDEHRRMNQFDPRLEGGMPTNALEEEFLRSTFGDSHRVAVDRLSSRLAGMPLHGMQGPAPTGSWADEFAVSHPKAHAPFESHFEDAFRQGEMERVWAGHPGHAVAAVADMEAMERAYSEASRVGVHAPLPAEQHQADNWASEYERDQASAWVEEFTAQERQNQSLNDEEKLSSIAGRLIDSVSDPKMQHTKFMDFMRQLRDRKVTISDNKVVETNSGLEWVSEFAVHDAADPSSEWASAFAASSSSSAAVSTSKDDWASEFAREERRHLESAVAAPSWADEFNSHMRDVAGPAAAVAAAAQAHALNNGTPVVQISAKEARLADWVQQYRQNIEPLRDATWDQWDQADKPWERYRFTGFGYEGFGREMYSTYVPQRDNPFIESTAPYQAGIQAIREHRNVDAILAFEAEVHRNPENAAAWLLLGRAQAENENDVLAIAALQKATAADPTALEGWIDLAASYSNENCRVEAFKALHTWLSRHPKYGSQPFVTPLDVSGHIQNQLVQQFLSAARLDLTNMDPDVQVVLGLLFNMSSEHDKATDCFAAALQGRPDDYALWNRLGACQSKSGHDEESITSYHRALSINPSFVRARVNLGLSCISLGVYDQAAEHMLTALAIQGSGPGPSTAPTASPVWDTLLHAVNLMSRPDLTAKVVGRDLPGLLSVFNIHA